MGLAMVRLGDKTSYFPGGTNVGLFVDEGKDAYLVDSGNDKEAGRRLLSALNAEGLTLKAIINTHSNADHCGGNRFLQERTSCKIICPDIEAVFLSHPVLEPSMLFGGLPPDELMTKFFMAQPSLAEKGGMEALPEGILPIELPGHYFGMCGYLTSDRVFFAADSLFSEKILDKYHISFIHDIKAYLSTLDLLCTIDCDMYVPSHAEPAADINHLSSVNKAKVLEIAGLILDLCKKPMSAEAVLKGLFDHYDMRLDLGQYALAGSTVKSFLTYLRSSAQISMLFEDNTLVYVRS